MIASQGEERGGDREKGGEGRENMEQEDPGRSIEGVLDPVAVPSLRRGRLGDPVTCPESAVTRWSTGEGRGWVGAEQDRVSAFVLL